MTMQLSKIILVSTLALPMMVGMAGCSSAMIGKNPGSDRVSLADASPVGGCQSKGKTIVSVLAKIGFIDRAPEPVEDNLYQLARNNAVEAGADTLVKGESKEFGTRTFEMYKCRP
jgi:hypothetical protein